MGEQNNIRDVMANHRLIPVVTFTNNDDPKSLMEYLISNGINCIEVTLRTPEGMEAIETLKKAFGSKFLVGAGTVTNPAQVEILKSKGADFLVSPGLTPTLQKAMMESKIPYLPGVATPGEIIKAMEMGLDTMKFFPANLFGGLDALKAYGSVFSDISFCPTGGITQESSLDYLSLPNVFAVGGTWFQKKFKTDRQV